MIAAGDDSGLAHCCCNATPASETESANRDVRHVDQIAYCIVDNEHGHA